MLHLQLFCMYRDQENENCHSHDKSGKKEISATAHLDIDRANRAAISMREKALHVGWNQINGLWVCPSCYEFLQNHEDGCLPFENPYSEFIVQFITDVSLSMKGDVSQSSIIDAVKNQAGLRELASQTEDQAHSLRLNSYADYAPEYFEKIKKSALQHISSDWGWE